MRIRFGIIGLLLILVCSFSLITSCSSGTSNGNNAAVQSPSGDDAPYTEPEDSAIPTDITAGADAGVQVVSIRYYTVNAATDELRNCVTAVSADTMVTADTILGLIIDSLADQSVNLAVDSISFEDSRCIISFTESIKIISQTDTGLEDAVLDACAQSILDNISSCSSVAYRIEGNAYVTQGHSFDLDSDYMDD